MRTLREILEALPATGTPFPVIEQELKKVKQILDRVSPGFTAELATDFDLAEVTVSQDEVA